MPTAAPEDDASERALRASTVGPTLSFALLGLVTVLAIGLLGLTQHASLARDRGLAATALAGPSLGALGSSSGDRAAAPIRSEPLRPVATGLLTSWSAPGVATPPEGAAVSVGGGSGLAADLPGEGTSSGPVDEPAAGPVRQPAPAPGRKPTAKKPVAKKPVAKKPAGKKPVVKKPAAKKLAAKKPAAKKLAAKKPAAKKLAAKKPAAKKPAAKKPAGNTPVAKKLAAKKPAAKKLAVRKPATGTLAVHHPEPGKNHDARRGTKHRSHHGQKHGKKHGPSPRV